MQRGARDCLSATSQHRSHARWETRGRTTSHTTLPWADTPPSALLAGNSRPVKQRSKRREQGRGAAVSVSGQPPAGASFAWALPWYCRRPAPSTLAFVSIQCMQGATLLAEREVAITAAPAADRQPSPSSAKLPAVIPDVLEFPPHEEEAAAASPAAATTSAASPAAATAAAAAAVRVAVTVPGCHLQFGEHLRVVGNCPELGEWDAQAAPALIWHEDDVWKGELTLPSGRHVAFKLVIVRGDGVTLYWEPGADRRLRVPRLDAAAAADDAGLLVTCRFADTRGTVVECPQLQVGAEGVGSWSRAGMPAPGHLLAANPACSRRGSMPAAWPSEPASPFRRSPVGTPGSARPLHRACRKQRGRRPPVWPRCRRSASS